MVAKLTQQTAAGPTRPDRVVCLWGKDMLQSVHGTRPEIACCLCGRPTADAVDGRCLHCLAATVDITEGISKQHEIEMCKPCEQNGIHCWYRNPQWVRLEPESAELLSVCLRKVRGLKTVRLVDASWIWQEPHCRRLKIKMTVQKEWQSSVVQQSFVAEYTVKTRACDKCNKMAAKQDAWMAKVQVRQRAEHPRTLAAMEQQMIRRQAELGKAPPIQVKRTKDGLDFHFARRQHAQRFVSLLHSLAPCRSKSSSALIAANLKLGTSNVQHVWSVEVAPISKGDLVRLPKALAGGAAGGAQWALVGAVGGSVRLVDPTSGRTFEISGEAYWRHPFAAVASRKQLSTFVVLDVEADDEVYTSAGAGAGAGAESRWRPADATVARTRDFGANDIQHLVRTHLGGAIDAGDEALGYDLEGMTSIDEAGESELPQAVLLVEKKRPPKAAATNKQRANGSARRRRRKGGGSDSDDGESSVCSSTSYQTDVSEMMDGLAVSGEGGEGGDDESVGEEELATLGAGLGEFIGTIVHEDDEDDEDDEVEPIG